MYEKDLYPNAQWKIPGRTGFSYYFYARCYHHINCNLITSAKLLTTTIVSWITYNEIPGKVRWIFCFGICWLNLKTSAHDFFMHQLTYLLIAFTTVLCLAIIVIAVLNKTVSRLQKENTRLTLKIKRLCSLDVEKASNGSEPLWKYIDPIKVAKEVYESGITSLNWSCEDHEQEYF